MRLRLALIVPGVLVGLWGAWLLLQRGFDNLVATVAFLAGGVIAHDGLIAPLVIAICLLGVRLLPPVVRRPAVVALVVLGSVTLAAVPVLGRFGARPDNPTLLDRDYTGGWLLIVGLVVGGVVAGSVYLHRSRR